MFWRADHRPTFFFFDTDMVLNELLDKLWLLVVTILCNSQVLLEVELELLCQRSLFSHVRVRTRVVGLEEQIVILGQFLLISFTSHIFSKVV